MFQTFILKLTFSFKYELKKHIKNYKAKKREKGCSYD